MRILLINPSQEEVYGKLKAPTHPPLGLAYVGAVLEQAGHQVTILDVDCEGISTDGLIEKYIRPPSFDVVGLIVVTPTFKRVVRMCQRFKEANPKLITVIGGIHPTIQPRQSAEPEVVDYVVKGEGEETARELVEALEGKRPFSQINGLVWKQDGRIIENPTRLLAPDLDQLPFPAWHLFTKLRYTYPEGIYAPIFPIFTSRGCPANCTYCQTKNIFTRRFRARSAKNVVDEIEWLVKRWAAREIHIWDDNYPTDRRRVFQIRDELAARGLTHLKFAFPNGMRADFVNEEVMRAMKDMGVYMIACGVESGNERILEVIEKGTNMEKVRETYRLAHKVGLETWGFFMLGLPEETDATIQDTINFAKELDPDIAKFHILQPYPGSKVFYQLEAQGLIKNHDYENYGIHSRPVHRLKDLTEDDLLAWQGRAYRQFYLRPKKLWQTLVKRSTSWLRFKTNMIYAWSLFKAMILRTGEQRWLGEMDSMEPVASSPALVTPTGEDPAKVAEAWWHQYAYDEIEFLEKSLSQAKRDAALKAMSSQSPSSGEAGTAVAPA